MEKTIKDILADITILDSNLVAMHQTYLQQREELVAPLREKYNAHKAKVEKKRRELQSLLSINMMEMIQHPTEPQPKVAEDLYGWALNDSTDVILQKISKIGDL